MTIVLNGTTGIEFPTSNTPSFTNYQGSVVVASTAVASTSGTAIDFTALPSWIKKITIIFRGTSLSATANLLVQLGTGSTTYTTSGYISTGNAATGGGNSINSSTTGFNMVVGTAARITSGHMVITNITGNNWVSSHAAKSDTGTVLCGAGDVSLGALLTAVRITSTSTDTFDAGSINIFYEG